MIKVAHVIQSYLTQSETFIWQYLRVFKEVFPVVVAVSKQNLEQFPLPNGKILLRQGPRFSVPWAWDNYYRRICKKPDGYIKKILIENNVKIIHAHFGPSGCELLPVALELNLPIITTFYGYDLSVFDILEKYSEDYKRLFEYGSAFLVEGPSMKRKLLNIGCPQKKIHIQRIAIDINNYSQKEYSTSNNNEIKLLFVGRFIEKKGIEYALRALAGVKRNTALKFQFKIAGYGELEEKLKKDALGQQIENNIVWLGRLTHSEVLQELKLCDIFVHPSVTALNGDSEGGAPTIILEAQASGVPVISTEHADIPYVAENNVAALLSPERDVKSLSENLYFLMKNKRKCVEMGKCGRKNMIKNHDARQEVKTLENLYKLFL